MMFVPRQPWTDASVGLGAAAPRAVPLDAVMSVVTSVFEGAGVARVALPVGLALAGWGAHRVLRDAGVVARLAAGGFAVWNPFVVERLALGQWALLMAYAALPWLGMAAWRFRDGGSHRDLASVTLWTALASLTPTGGMLAVATTATIGARRSWRTVRLVAVSLLLQLPWLVPAVSGPAGGTSDPAGVAAFAARSEGPGGPFVALLGLGAIWDSHSVPPTRETPLSLVAAAVVIALLVAGVPRLQTLLGAGPTRRVLLLGAASLAISAASITGPGADLLRWLVVELPGAGILRDAQKLLAPFVLVVVLATGATAQRVIDRGWRVEARLSIAMVFVAFPVVLLPDAAPTTWTTVEPVHYPDGFERVAAILSRSDDPGDLASLPWRSYRGFDWGNGQVSADPAARWFDRDLRAPDDLVVGKVTVQGEDPTARAMTSELRDSTPAAVMPRYGVRWLLVYLDDPDADELDLAGLRQEYADADLALYAVPGNIEEPVRAGPVRRASVLGVDVLAGLLVAGAGVIRATRSASFVREQRR
jgi:hypothetical protein